MKARLILLCLALSFGGIGLRAQQTQQKELPQVFSPNAAELGKYGKIPVSFFNGLPNISIPLTELRGKDYSLPVYLSYHSSGNKPDQHPGWVGLGWTLHAGGRINRIEHGMRDETTMIEAMNFNPWVYPDNPGYLYHASEYQNTQVDSTILAKTFTNNPPDMDPDEFQVMFEGLSSSFYLIGVDSVKIASANAIDYNVHIEVAPSESHELYGDPLISAIQYDYIKTICLTTGDGVLYRFGGDEDAIDFSYEMESPNSHGLKRIPTSWNISLIRFPNGEEISFEYIHSGMPIVTLDRHYYEYCGYDPQDPYNPYGYIVNTHFEPNSNISYTLISPSYLNRIHANLSGEDITFFVSPSIEKTDPVDSLVFKSKVTNQISRLKYSLCMSDNKYQKLDSIVSPRGTIRLDYTSSANERLKLQGVSIHSKWKEKQYGMRYNNLKLPDYHSRNTDMWGYYSQHLNHDETGTYYQVDTIAMKAEILEALEYPTGGETRFEYEAHRYGKVVRQYPFLLEDETGIAGGLRIKRIIDKTDEKEEVRYFRYVNEEGGSSGVLAVKPLFTAEGNVNFTDWDYKGWIDGVWFHIRQNLGTKEYSLSGERLLNQIPLTGGSHVTYSRVEECFPDFSKKVYYFTNHDCSPDEPYLQILTSYDDVGLFNSFSSNELSRGLLQKEEYYSRGRSFPVKVEEYSYSKDTNDFVFAINQIKYCRNILCRSSQIKYYTYYPGLVRKKVAEYSDDENGHPNIEISEYTFDPHRRLTKTIRRVGNVTERDTLTYTGNFSTGDYAGMVAHNMVSYPVEHVRFRKDTLQSEKIVSANLTTWKRSGDHFVPSEQYQANVGSGSTGTFRYYNGSRKDTRYLIEPEQKYTAYDSLGNIVLMENHARFPTSYVWTSDGCHPTAVFPGAKKGYTRYIASDVTRVKTFQSDLTEDIFLQFESVSSFTLRIWLTCPNNQCWDLTPVVDGTSYRIVCVNDSQAPNPWPAHAASYPSPLEIPVSAGIHTIRIHPGNHFYAANSPDPVTFSIELNYKEKQVTEQQIAGHTVVLEDFEDEAGELVPEGYLSSNGHRGTWTHPLDASKGPYYVDYRVYRNGKWNYTRKLETGTSTSINEGFAPIDHIRIYPVDCLPESYTWNDDGTLRSKTDSRGVTESYRYDGLGRLVGVYDNDGKKVEGYQYNYQNRGNE